MIKFKLHGEYALWRNFTDTQTRTSCPGPAPSHLSGIIGACLGFKNEGLIKIKAKWPVSPELLDWQQKNQIEIAARLLTTIKWNTANVNGCKTIGGTTNREEANLQISQMVLKNPEWEIIVKGKEAALEELENALKTPYFPTFLGCSQFRGFISKIEQTENPENSNWAKTTNHPEGYWTPLTQHLLEPTEDEEIIHLAGFLTYPLPDAEPHSIQFHKTVV